MLLSNGLFQIGFCQLNTTFNEQYGVGDDIHSIGYDGYRLSCWNQNENRYGKVWDIGDIIGVCINLDDDKIEYYQNGEKLGIVPINIEHDNCTAYFPALSFSEYEKCFINFGGTTLTYNYEGYEPLDIPKSQYNGSFEVTSLLLQCLSHSNFLEFLNKETHDDNEVYLKRIINQKIFYFLTNISFADFFLCKCLLFPFMYSLIKKNNLDFFVFMEQINANLKLNEYKTFYNSFFEKLTNLIEEYSVMGPKFYTKYELYCEVFLRIINNKKYFNIWNKTENFFGHLRNIFNSNVVKLGLVYGKLSDIFGDEKYNQSLGNIWMKITQEGNIVNADMNSYDEKYIDMNKKYIDIIFNYYQKTSTLCQATFIFYDLMRACYPINRIKDYNYDFNTFITTDNCKNIIAFKNVIISYMSYFFDKYNILDLNKLSLGSATIVQLPYITSAIINELSQTGIYVSYFKEENIGGKSFTILNKTLFDHNFNSTEIFSGNNNSYNICFNLLVRLISLLDKFFFAYYEFYAFTKNYIYAEYLPNERGTTFFNALFRYYFYLFNETSQIILYKISFFLIKWIYEVIINKNILNVLLIPLYLLDFPFQIVQLMLITKSKILYNEEYRKNINQSCPYFNNDDFLETLCNVYFNLLEDQRFAQYDALMQSICWKVYLLLRETKSRNIVLKNEEYIKKIILGISNLIPLENSERRITRFLSILQRVQYEYIKSYNEEELKIMDTNILNIKNTLSVNEFKNIFYSIIKNFCKNINSKLFTYKKNLDNCKQYCIDLNFIGDDSKRYIQSLNSSIKELIEIINFYELILNVSVDNFFNPDFLDLPLIYIRQFFIQLSKNILQEPYIEYLKKMLNYAYMKNIDIHCVIDCIINLILTIKQGNQKSFADFMISTRDILIKPFIDLYKYKYDSNTKNPYEIYMNKRYDEYNELFSDINNERIAYEENKIKRQKDMEFVDEELLCTICYSQIANYNIIPCFHKGCRECLLAYMAEHEQCFMCRQHYDSVVMIPDEEIQKKIEACKETIKGEENEDDNKNI